MAKTPSQLMAKACFDPQGSVTLWQNMAAASGDNQPPAERAELRVLTVGLFSLILTYVSYYLV
ncbi:hypothetical protein [Moritella sp. Urea-trap-13]|uniref:hypothetical protein n=1 Tax=Moritella sp. Urea-trap-13 TaxID=2058327 RepID=UPI001E3A0767|nr:hypothetical protein [Moritella sp. Urea-trap-13]